MDKASEAILALKPVTFRYKHELDPDGIPQFGLVAEDVEKVNPDLVARDADGKALHRALRSSERDAAQRVPERASHSAGTTSDDHAARVDGSAAEEVLPSDCCAAHCASG